MPFTTVDLVNSVISDLETMQMTGCSEFMIELSICSAEPDKATEEGSSWGILRGSQSKFRHSEAY